MEIYIQGRCKIEEEADTGIVANEQEIMKEIITWVRMRFVCALTLMFLGDAAASTTG